MKKILSCLIVALLLIMALASCQISGGTAKPTEPPVTEPPVNPLEQIASMLTSMYRSDYKDGKAVTPADYDRTTVLAAIYTVEWSVEIVSGDANDVVIVEKDETTITVNVNEEVNTEVEYKLIAVISDAEGNTYEVVFADRFIPVVGLMTWKDYMDAEAKAPVRVQGVITAISSTSLGATKNNIWMQDNDGGYYIYGLESDPIADLGLQVGMTVGVTGEKDIYVGTHEVKNAAVEIIDSTINVPAATDYTEIFANAESLKDAALIGNQALLVTIKGVTILPQDDDTTGNGYYKFELGGKTSYVRISSSECPLSKDNQATFKAAHAEHTGWTADVTGLVCVYSGNFYLIPVSVDAFNNFVLPERSDAEKVAYEQENLTFIENITESGEIVLNVNGVTYESVLISWASDNNCVVVEGGKLIVTLPEEATNVTITATLTCGETTLTKAFTVLVDAAATVQYAPNFLTSAPADGQYVFAMDQSAVEGYGVLYANGEIGSKGQLLTTDKAHKAAKFDIAAVEGGYTIKLGDKYLEGYLNGTYKNLRFSDTEAIWAWNDEAKVFTCDIDGAAYYFGTYLSSGVPKYDYMSLSAVSYITGDNLSKIDVSQFVGHVTTLVELVDKAFPVDAPVTGEYVFGMNQSAVEGYGWLYANGEIGSKGQLLTTNQLSKAAKFVVTAVEGGYTIKLGDKYLEGYLNGTYKNLRFSDTEAIWAWNDEAKVFTCDIDGAAYYFGTYLSSGVPKYDYMSLSAVSYITGDNLSKIDVSQFVGHLCEVKTVPAGDVHQHVAGAEWQKDADNHWNVCECGEIMNKAAHDFSNGDCVCGQAAPVVCEHQASSEWFKDDNNHWHNCALCGAEMDKAAHDFSNGDCACGQEAPVVGPTYTSIVEAIEIGDAKAHDSYTTEKYTVAGVIVNVYNTTYGNMYIADEEGNQLCIYGTYTADGSTRYDAMSYKPVVGDYVVVTGVLGKYNTTVQMKNGWILEVTAHEHNYNSVVTEPDCTNGGYTTHTCTICNAYYQDSETEELGHTTDNGTCERCGQEIGGSAPVIETIQANWFANVSATNQYGSRTDNFWSATNAAIMQGGNSDSNPTFKVLGTAATKGVTLNGKTSAKGVLTSSTISGGISAIRFTYTNPFTESNGVDITITITKADGTTITKKLDNNSVTKLTAYEFEWELGAEAFSGDFTITITNNSPSSSTSNKDRVCIWNLEWDNYPAN